MSLLQNVTNINSIPMTRTGGTLADSWFQRGLTDQTYLGVFSSVSQLSAIPDAYAPGDAWLMPTKDGQIGFVGEADLVGAAVLNSGRNMEATANLSLTKVNATLDQILDLSADASLMLIGDAHMTATVSMTAPGTITLSKVNALLGGIVSLTATGTGTLSGTVTPSALAFMIAEAGGPTPLSPEGLAAAVWDAADSDFNTSGTMGGKLNSAASAGDPWSTLIPGAYVPGSAGYLLSTLAVENPDIAEQLLDLWRRLGLDPANPLVNTDTAITAGAGLQIEVLQLPSSTTTTRV